MNEFWIRCDTLLTPFQHHSDCYLQISEGTIQQILPGSEIRGSRKGKIVYEPGAVVAPGFIDLHVHGAKGRDFMDGTLESLQELSSTLARHGTTSFLPTTMSAPDADTEAVLREFARNRHLVKDGSAPLGIHMEGPFLNPICRGTHVERYLKPADVAAFQHFREIAGNSILRITVAPEMDAGLALTREAAATGIEVSIGHSNATADQARAAVDAGARHATHTFNAMRPFHQREPGILGLVLTDERVFAEVICDGVHVHPVALQLLLSTKGIRRLLLITDGLSAVDMPDGSYPLADRTIVVQHQECRDAEGRLAGSTLTLDRAVGNLVHWFKMPLSEALAAASTSPARSMNLRQKGIIGAGADADLVFLDAQLQVVRTMVTGRTVYSRRSLSY